jgi:hypothetical protein
MPKSIKDLDIDGNDLISLGYKNEKISQLFSKILERIFSGNLNNFRDNILEYIRSST